jgi:murein L,D-transpeptidase YcbB/YkuD
VPAGRALKPGEGDSPARLAALRDRLAAEGLVGGASGTAGDSVHAAASDSSRGRAAAGVNTGAVAGRGDAAAAGAAGATPAPRRAVRAGQAVYDHALAAGVAAFQSRHGIAVDSALGPETVKALNVPVAYRMGQIAANLERHRWLPRSLGARYVVANVPAFRLEAYEGGKKALEMKVVVGKDYEDRKTPVFADSMRTVVFRPYWNITDDIAAKETWPKIRANPGYMEEEQLETYTEGGKTRLRQKPGEKNSLGLVKFLFPNAYNIYFHDTPEKQLFAKDVRDFSHGCIRLEKPEELAQWALGWDAGRVQQAMVQGQDNQEVKLAQPLPVYIAYFTTYLKDGQLYFGNDLYARDAEVVAAMEARGGQSGEVVQAVEALRSLVAG